MAFSVSGSVRERRLRHTFRQGGIPVGGGANLGGMACVNATAVLYEGDPAPLAEAIAERLATIEPLPSEDERAILPTQPAALARALGAGVAPKERNEMWFASASPLAASRARRMASRRLRRGSCYSR